MADYDAWQHLSEKRRELLVESHKAAGLQICFAKFGGHRVRYAKRHGTGTPLLICNGIGSNLELTTPLIRELSERPVVVFDVPGTGGSECRGFVPTFKFYSRLAMKVMEAAGFSEEIIVGGVSWGGGLAQQIARDYPSRVTHLLLMATSPGITMIPGKFRAMALMTTPRRFISRRFMADNAHTIYGGEMRNSPESAKSHARVIIPPRYVAYAQQLMTMWGFSSLPWLRDLRCRTLVMSGDDDPLIRLANAKILTHLIPGAEMKVVTGGGHLFMTQSPKETAQSIDEWLIRTNG